MRLWIKVSQHGIWHIVLNEEYTNYFNIIKYKQYIIVWSIAFSFKNNYYTRHIFMIFKSNHLKNILGGKCGIYTGSRIACIKYFLKLLKVFAGYTSRISRWYWLLKHNLYLILLILWIVFCYSFYLISLMSFATGYLCLWTHLIVEFSSNYYFLNVDFTYDLSSALSSSHLPSCRWLHPLQGLHILSFANQSHIFSSVYSSLVCKSQCPVGHLHLHSHWYSKLTMLQLFFLLWFFLQ